MHGFDAPPSLSEGVASSGRLFCRHEFAFGPLGLCEFVASREASVKCLLFVSSICPSWVYIRGLAFGFVLILRVLKAPPARIVRARRVRCALFVCTLFASCRERVMPGVAVVCSIASPRLPG